jgi:hypothetical protein
VVVDCGCGFITPFNVEQPKCCEWHHLGVGMSQYLENFFLLRYASSTGRYRVFHQYPEIFIPRKQATLSWLLPPYSKVDSEQALPCIQCQSVTIGLLTLKIPGRTSLIAIHLVIKAS